MSEQADRNDVPKVKIHMEYNTPTGGFCWARQDISGHRWHVVAMTNEEAAEFNELASRIMKRWEIERVVKLGRSVGDGH